MAGAMHGFGDYIWSNNRKVYSGFYKKDFKEGLGLQFDRETFDIYLGFWSKGLKDGPAFCILKKTKLFLFFEKGRKLKTFANKLEAIKYLNLYHGSRLNYLKFFEVNFEELIKAFTPSSFK